MKNDPGHESMVIKKIVDTIFGGMFPLNSDIDEGLVGMRARLQDLISQLEMGSRGVRMVGIWGLGGGGKTTLATSVCMEIKRHFKTHCIIENIRDRKSDLNKLQGDILSALYKLHLLPQLHELYLHRIERMEEGRINGNELKTKLKKIRTQIIKLQMKRMPPKRTSTFETPAITLATIRQLINDGISLALKTQAASMANADNTNKNNRTKRELTVEEKESTITKENNDTSYVSKKSLCDESLIITKKEIWFNDKLNYMEESVEIMDREIKQLRRRCIPIVKVRWNSEFTWLMNNESLRSEWRNVFHPPRFYQNLEKFYWLSSRGVVLEISRRVKGELLPPKKRIRSPSSSSTTLSNSSRNQTCDLVSPSSSVYTTYPPQIFEIGKCSIKMYLKHHEGQIEDILNYLDELYLHHIEKMEEGRIDRMIIRRNNDELKTELKKIRTQINKTPRRSY
ncbi:reverse transcriptase domain-containing protein [Tanacetum coccineum]